MSQQNYILGQHLVVFLDVLGQRQQFRELRLPRTPEERVQVLEVLRSTAGFVVGIRKMFQDSFDAFEEGTPNIRALTKNPLRPKFVGFSDSFVTSVPLRNDDGDLAPVAVVYSALSAAALVMLSSLAVKHALRGGIDVGFGVEICPGEIYGTALERAYLLESENAQYPRIVIGDELWQYLNSILAAFEKQTTPLARSITRIAHKAIELIATDVDGMRILDYLGRVIVGNSGQNDPTKEMVRLAYEFVLAEESRIKAQNNNKLIPRYALLRGYFESRLPLWGLDSV